MSRSRPRLKEDVDRQLQNAFHEGNWLVVARLAEKRARTLSDEYYQIVKVCAESQFDDPALSYAAVRAIDGFVRQDTVIKDVDAIDLLEWAAAHLLGQDGFAATLGTLRVRLVKAWPKNRVAATRCLESCLLHWDLVSAQQIAAILDRSIPGERSYMFWNISITHLLATSTQAPPEKKKLYGSLAQKQIERAVQVTEQARNSSSEDGPPLQPARGIRSEEEVLLLYDIIDTHGTSQDFAKLFYSPIFSPVSQFRLGRKEPFLRAVDKYRRQGDWQVVFELCSECLADGDEDDEPTLLACDWLVWRSFIEAASQLKSVNIGTTKTVQSLLVRLLKSKRLRPIYKRNIMLARLSVAFQLGSGDEDDLQDGRPHSMRMRELIAYLEDQKTSLACFDDIKGSIDKLDAPALSYVAYSHMPHLAGLAQDAVVAARLRLLALKAQYLAATCPQSSAKVAGKRPSSLCLVCKADFGTRLCGSCLSTISHKALKDYLLIGQEGAGSMALENEIRPQFALIVALCNINLAFSNEAPGYAHSASPLPQHLLRALLILEHSVQFGTKNCQISLVLVQLHLRLGSVHRARQIWKELAVKRTIVDSLAPIFLDRLSTIAPIALKQESWGPALLDSVTSHYTHSLKMRMPRRLIDAFESGNYNSILEIPKYVESLRASCTRCMSLIEEARVDRLAGDYNNFLDDSRYLDARNEVSLQEIIDYGSFPSWECSSCVPLHVRLGIGPRPSSVRSHLSLSAEAFHQVLGYKPPSAIKMSVAGSMPSQAYLDEHLERIRNSMQKFLPHAGPKCTNAEMLYFETVYLACGILPMCRRENKAKETLHHLKMTKQAVKSALKCMLEQISKHNKQTGAESEVALMMALHTAALLRDTIAAVIMAYKWIQGNIYRAKEESTSSHVAKEIVAEAKALQTLAEDVGKKAKARFSPLDFGAGSVDQLKSWVMKDEFGQLRDKGEWQVGWQVLEKSWRDNIKGWKQMVWTQS
ncbi:hypothetical protein CDD81_6804 [Ophiocordyceps australis]|uniref:N-acetyltransferase B complex non catalytic subunit n=1 Tax=Ophiocordyceps australis TaxID=1399860 RepID=A0A2C5XHC3_9HYPO|nr:hypothetical protein CDD81_6804 [Ophiocordyceps australis]